MHGLQPGCTGLQPVPPIRPTWRTEPRHPSPLQPALETAPLRPCNPAVLCIQARPAEPIHVGGVRYTELAACGLAQRFIRTLLSPHTLPQQPK